MINEFHILNGDSLKTQLPSSLIGRKIVARLCLVDGDVKAESLEELFQVRASFIRNHYPDFSKEEYYSRTVSEINKIKNIPNDTIINLWFEDDLFCQVNFWFIIHFIKSYINNPILYLIRPKKGCEYSFGNMHPEELITSFSNRVNINDYDFNELSKLWRLYQQNDCDLMIQIAEKLKHNFLFLTPAINAHKDRLSNNKYLGRPIESLKKIIEELDLNEFGPVFQEFCKREAIYGFGDLQVKRMFDNILK